MFDEDDNEIPYDPEDCDECDCPAGDFEDSDYRNGAWHCPECGQPQ